MLKLLPGAVLAAFVLCLFSGPDFSGLTHPANELLLRVQQTLYPR